MPMPKINRPFDSTSSEASSFASTGLRCVQDDYAGAEANCARVRRDECQRDTGLEHRTVGRDRRRRHLRIGQNHVLSRPKAFEAGLLCRFGDGGGGFRRSTHGPLLSESMICASSRDALALVIQKRGHLLGHTELVAWPH